MLHDVSHELLSLTWHVNFDVTVNLIFFPQAILVICFLCGIIIDVLQFFISFMVALVFKVPQYGVLFHDDSLKLLVVVIINFYVLITMTTSSTFLTNPIAIVINIDEKKCYHKSKVAHNK